MSEALILTYVTSNDRKFLEAQAVFPGLTRLKLDLPEIQTLDHEELIEAKLEAARGMIPDVNKRIIIVEDGANYFEGLGQKRGLPGTLIKHFTEEMGPDGLWKLAQAFNVTRGYVELMVGVLERGEKMSYFTGRVEGSIVPPRVQTIFAFDRLFQPDLGNPNAKTFAEMTQAEKIAISHRGIALRKVREYLENELQWQFFPPPLP